MDNNKYMLVMEKKDFPGDYEIIFLDLINQEWNINNSLEFLDNITSTYNKDEFRKLILDSNTITDNYKDGNIVIKGPTKYRNPVVYKETFENFNLNIFLYNNINDKLICNKLYNRYDQLVRKNKDNNSVEFKNILLEETLEIDSKINSIYNMIMNLSYLKRRMLILDIIYNMTQKVKVKKLETLSAA